MRLFLNIYSARPEGVWLRFVAESPVAQREGNWVASVTQTLLSHVLLRYVLFHYLVLNLACHLPSNPCHGPWVIYQWTLNKSSWNTSWSRACKSRSTIYSYKVTTSKTSFYSRVISSRMIITGRGGEILANIRSPQNPHRTGVIIRKIRCLNRICSYMATEAV